MTDRLLTELRLDFAVVTVIYWSVGTIFWLLVHALGAFGRKMPPGVTYLGVLLWLTGAALFWPMRRHHWVIGRDLGTSWLLLGGGLTIYALLALFHLTRGRHLKRIDRSARLGLAEMSGDAGDAVLVREGLYAAVRNPIYFFTASRSLGHALVANYSGVYVCLAGFLLLLVVTVLLEERELERRFGETYRCYKREVPRLMPRLPVLWAIIRSRPTGAC